MSVEAGNPTMPSGRDLDAAFYLADLDHNGTIDM
jgi:hypothetical protein